MSALLFCQEIVSTPSTRPVTASGASHAYHDAEGDLYIKYKKLQKQLEFLQVLHIVLGHRHIQHELFSFQLYNVLVVHVQNCTSV